MSKSPARRLVDLVWSAGLRPPATMQLSLHRPNNKPVELAGKRVLVTGASSGIGAAAVAKFVRHGATVVAVARRAELLDAVVDKATRNNEAGGTAFAIAADLSELDAVDALVADVEQRLGGVDILVNNAGRSIVRPIAESLERWHDLERTMAINYYAPLRLIRGFVPGMFERGDGHLINVATWGVMFEASANFGAYNATKAALASVSRVMETEWSGRGVHSTTLYFPLVTTPMMEPTGDFDGRPALTPDEAAGWMIVAARRRPVRIAPRTALAVKALDTMNSRWSTEWAKSNTVRPGR
ncbi:MAG TPA: SDR family oxidoreductase [Mycobacterium sp.]|nr:SDR family oxidoreductase [Mycobacterium sp.]